MDRQDLLDELNRFEVALYFVLNRGSKPSLWLLAVEKADLTLSRFSASPRPAKLPTRCQKFLDIRSRQHFTLEQDGLRSSG